MELAWGNFGENLTTQGLVEQLIADAKASLGER
jgi:MOSC domain-containing protein YiiM